jgi:hypothetical protein
MHWNYMDLAMVFAFGCCAIGYSELIGRYSIVLAIGNSASASIGGILQYLKHHCMLRSS